MHTFIFSHAAELLIIVLSQFVVIYNVFYHHFKKPRVPHAHMENSNIIVSIEGNIGSGKSTLLDRLKLLMFKNKKFVFIQEPVDEWEQIKNEKGETIVQLFYGDQEKYAFPFQIMAYTSRLRNLKKALKENQNSIIICERSLFTDKMVFAKMLRDTNKISYVDYQIYLDIFNDFSKEFPLHKIIYVKADPKTCLERVEIRDRAGEKTISLGYLDSCHKYHNDMITQLPVEKLILDGNQNIYEQAQVLNDWLASIEKFVEE
jgi:deoxyadenosine/deoxycytidine kinase